MRFESHGDLGFSGVRAGDAGCRAAVGPAAPGDERPPEKWEPCGDGPERGFVGFLWGRPEAFGGSPNLSFRDFRPWLIEADSRLGPGGSQRGLPSRPSAHPGGGRVTAKTAVLGVGHDAV